MKSISELQCSGIINDDIDLILNEVSDRAIRQYYLDYMELINDAMRALKNDMVRPAEVFYYSLLKTIPTEDILQHRIGLDNTTKIPTTLTVISNKHADKIPEIIDMACALELFIFKTLEYNCHFWVITDKKLDKELIGQDFPYLRRTVNVNT
ncbi:MAG: hypothetical protein LBB56_03445 [Chitinispirillales bacterium]|nr:hypothetical protein [Chitinispirillales bacterium]